MSSVKIRSFKSSGGAVLLIWEVCVLIVVYQFYNSIDDENSTTFVFFAIGVSVAVFLFFLSSFFADVVFGRYKVIRCSLFFVWAAIMIQSIASIVVHILDLESSMTWTIVSAVLKLLSMVGCGAFLVNSLHFGIDQMMDAPSWQLSSYISWYCWCFFIPDVFEMLLLKCTPYPWSTIGTGFVASITTLAVCIDILFHKRFIKEPTSPNPLKLICSVLLYAKNNKYPRARSAFSYWDNKKFRINLAKTKYGGPFTSEEVEDVKSFLRMLVVIVIGSFFTGYFIVFASTEKFLYYRFRDDDFKDETKLFVYGHCIVRYSFHQFSSFIIIVLVPFLELIVYPLLQKLVNITSLAKFKVGMFFWLLTQFGFLSLDFAGYFTNHNTTLPCLFESTKVNLLQGNTYSLSFYWLGMPKLFSAIAYYLIFTSTTEFLCAQSPYSMKGLLQGLTYSMVSISIILSYGIRYVFKEFKWHSMCGTLYFVVSSALTIGLIVVVFIGSRWYYRRRRRENVHDEVYEESYNSMSHQYAALTEYQQ